MKVGANQGQSARAHLERIAELGDQSKTSQKSSSRHPDVSRGVEADESDGRGDGATYLHRRILQESRSLFRHARSEGPGPSFQLESSTLFRQRLSTSTKGKAD
jgi:hypothetical protein